MRRALIGFIVVTAILGVVLVLSMDEEPPNVERLAVADVSVPDEDNGYLTVVAALDSLRWPDDDAWVSAHVDETSIDRERADELLADNADALDALSHALEAPAFNAPVDPSGPQTPVSGFRRLGLLATIATERALTAGEPRPFDALERFDALARRIQGSGTMLQYLTGYALETLVAQQVVRLARKSSDAEPLRALGRGFARPAWDEEVLADALRREYAFMLVQIESGVALEGRLNRLPLAGRYLYQQNRTTRLIAESFEEAIDGLAEPCTTAPSSDPPAKPSRFSYVAPNSIGRILQTIGTSSITGTTFTRCREELQRGFVMVVVALHAYRIEHGRLPETLDALVPETLELLPMDLDDNPYRYSAAEQALYSIGEDRFDGGAGRYTHLVDFSAANPGVSLAAEPR